VQSARAPSGLHVAPLKGTRLWSCAPPAVPEDRIERSAPPASMPLSKHRYWLKFVRYWPGSSLGVGAGLEFNCIWCAYQRSREHGDFQCELGKEPAFCAQHAPTPRSQLGRRSLRRWFADL